MELRNLATVADLIIRSAIEHPLERGQTSFREKNPKHTFDVVLCRLLRDEVVEQMGLGSPGLTALATDALPGEVPQLFAQIHNYGSQDADVIFSLRGMGDA